MKKKLLSLITAFVLVLSTGSLNIFANEKVSENTDEPVVIGSFDGKLSYCWDSDEPMPKIASRVRINSYATYDKRKGIQVSAKLYVPATSFPKAKFTSMIGTATVQLNGKKTNKSFSKYEKGTPTIAVNVNTGVTGKSGNKGTINVSGAATALNALAGGGGFSIAYPVTIP